MPVKIFSGVDHIVEKTINRFIRDLEVLDIRISSHIHNETPQVTVLVLYKGSPPEHAAAPGLL